MFTLDQVFGRRVLRFKDLSESLQFVIPAQETEITVQAPLVGEPIADSNCELQRQFFPRRHRERQQIKSRLGNVPRQATDNALCSSHEL